MRIRERSIIRIREREINYPYRRKDHPYMRERESVWHVPRFPDLERLRPELKRFYSNKLVTFDQTGLI
jgi:hypothetical protein